MPRRMRSSITSHYSERVATREGTRWAAIVATVVALALLAGHYRSQAAEPGPALKKKGTTAPITGGTTAPAGTPASPIKAAGPPLAALPGEFAIQTVLKGNFLTAVGGGGRITDVIHTDATRVAAWEKFRLLLDPGNRQYAIQTVRGNFLTAVGGGGRITDVIHSDATQAAGWEKFRVSIAGVPNVPYGAYAIQTTKGNYLTATGGGGHNTDPPAVHTDATRIGSWETFWLLKCGDPGMGYVPNLNYPIYYRIAISPGRYLLANRGGGQIKNAISDTTRWSVQTYGPWSDEWTRFRLNRQGDGSYALQTVDGHYVTAIKGGGLAQGTADWDNLVTDRTQVQAWEKFRLVDQGNCTYAIQTVSGYYLGSGPQGISTGISNLNSAYKFRLNMFPF